MSSQRGDFFYLTQLTFVASLGGFLFGFDTGVISGCTDQLTAQFALTDWGLGFVSSSAILGCILGALTAGLAADYFGRKPVLAFAAVLFSYAAFASMLPEYALGGVPLGHDVSESTVRLLIVARFVGGVGIGISSMVCPLYLAEISPARVRGAKISYYQLAIVTGMVITYFTNALIHHYATARLESLTSTPLENTFFNFIFFTESWRGKFGVGLLPAFLFFILVFFTTESPRWLCMKGKIDQARRIFTRIDGENMANEEIVAVEKVLSEESGTFFELFEPKFRIALIVGFFLPLLGQFSGINAIMYYGPAIFVNAGMGIANAFQSQVLIGIINVVCTFIAILLVDRLGRRPLIFWGTIGLMVSLLWGGINALCGVGSGLLIVVPFLLFVACFAFSLGPLPWIVIAEIFPTRIRGQAMSIGIFAIWFGCFLVTQLFFTMQSTFGQGYTLLIFMGLVSLTIPLVLFLIPETKGKTLEEIQEHWNRISKK